MSKLLAVCPPFACVSAKALGGYGSCLVMSSVLPCTLALAGFELDSLFYGLTEHARPNQTQN